MSLILLVGAGLMIRTLQALSTVPLGFETSHLLSLQFSTAGPKYTKEGLQTFYAALLGRIRALPGVESAALTLSLPIDGSQWGSVFIVGDHPIPERAKLPGAAFIPSSTDYFKTMHLRLLRGRSFDERDRGDSLRVCVINETMARQFWPKGDPIGKRIKQGWPETPMPWREVIGVVEDVKLNGIDSPTPLEVYLPLTQESNSALFLVVRTDMPEQTLIEPIRNVVRTLDAELPVFRARSMEQVIRASQATRISTEALFSVFSGIALVLAVIGLYGLIAQGVGQRKQEIGIRMALGAQPRDVLRLILGEGARLIALGLALGLVGAGALARVLTGQLYSIKPSDPATYLGVSVLLTAVALGACAIPARRAARVDPVRTLRNE